MRRRLARGELVAARQRTWSSALEQLAGGYSGALELGRCALGSGVRTA